MKILSRVLLILLATALSVSTLQAKKKQEAKTVYAFAIGTCLKDSTFYTTAICALDSAVVNDKNHFLEDRSLYSYQLKVYLDKLYKTPHTCALFFSTKRNKLEKQYTQLRRHYSRKVKDVRLVELPVSDFKFINVNRKQ